MSIIKTENLTHIYGQGTPFESVAIDNINIEIEQGEFVGVIGHTGSGKSTLIQHLNGLLKPNSGKIYINGKDIWANKKEIRQVRFDVGLVFQYPEYQLFEETIYNDIAYGPKNMGLDEKEIQKRVFEAMEFVGLDLKTANQSPFEMSGGQKRRVAIAGVIAMNPKILILDEPAAGLDPKGRDKILSQISEYHKTQKNTILLVSHSMEDVAKYSDKILVMNNSKVFTYDSVDNVFEKSEEIYNMGLEIPQITKILKLLKQKGYDIKTNIYTVEKAKEEILRLLKGGNINA